MGRKTSPSLPCCQRERGALPEMRLCPPGAGVQRRAREKPEEEEGPELRAPGRRGRAGSTRGVTSSGRTRRLLPSHACSSFFQSFWEFLCALNPPKTEMIQPAYSKGKCLNFSSYELLSCKGRQLSISSFWLKQLLTSSFLAEGFGLNHDWNTSCALTVCFAWTATLLGRTCKETVVWGWPGPL